MCIRDRIDRCGRMGRLTQRQGGSAEDAGREVDEDLEYQRVGRKMAGHGVAQDGGWMVAWIMDGWIRVAHVHLFIGSRFDSSP